jgi:hypothetical protein
MVIYISPSSLFIGQNLQIIAVQEPLKHGQGALWLRTANHVA